MRGTCCWKKQYSHLSIDNSQLASQVCYFSVSPSLPATRKRREKEREKTTLEISMCDGQVAFTCLYDFLIHPNFLLLSIWIIHVYTILLFNLKTAILHSLSCRFQIQRDFWLVYQLFFYWFVSYSYIWSTDDAAKKKINSPALFVCSQIYPVEWLQQHLSSTCWKLI